MAGVEIVGFGNGVEGVTAEPNPGRNGAPDPGPRAETRIVVPSTGGAGGCANGDGGDNGDGAEGAEGGCARVGATTVAVTPLFGTALGNGPSASASDPNERARKKKPRMSARAAKGPTAAANP